MFHNLNGQDFYVGYFSLKNDKINKSIFKKISNIKVKNILIKLNLHLNIFQTNIFNFYQLSKKNFLLFTKNIFLKLLYFNIILNKTRFKNLNLQNFYLYFLNLFSIFYLKFVLKIFIYIYSLLFLLKEIKI